MKIIALLTLLLVGACATPVSHTNIPLSTYDKDTEYGIEERPDGFGITVYYSRYQFIPESDAVATACKSALISIALEVAENKCGQIDPINEQGIRISMGRNGLSASLLVKRLRWSSVSSSYKVGLNEIKPKKINST